MMTEVRCITLQLSQPLSADGRAANVHPRAGVPARHGGAAEGAADARLPAGALGVRGSKIGKISKFLQFWAGSFSAVSKRNFARKYAFDSIFQALQDLHTFAPLQSQNFRKKSV